MSISQKKKEDKFGERALKPFSYKKGRIRNKTDTASC